MTSKVDQKKRVVLPSATPGDVFDVQRVAENRFVLVRLEKPAAEKRMTAAQCRRAMSAAPLKPHLTWDELRAITREP